MDLLPRSHKEFASVSYWEKFFRKRGQKAFEWYGEYPELCGVLHKYIKPKDKVLHIGCGNSKLSADLYDIGYTHIVNIDISDTVIKQMTEQHRSTRPDLKFLKMDMCKLDFEDGEFNVVLDKGTLDAVFTDTNESTLKTVHEMFSEIGRILRVGGRFVCISLAQDHILKKVTEYFPNEGWMSRICYVSQGDSCAEKDFHMPVFAYVFTKFKKMPNMKPILEIAPFEDKVERVENGEKLIEAVKQLQNYGVIRQQLSKGTSSLDEHISLDLYNADSAVPRYTIHVVDSKTAKRNKFAAFIVPQGREHDWMFFEKDGREQLCDDAGFQRLLVVTLHRRHKYDSMEQVKAELSPKVMELSPEKVSPKQVPYLSLGDSISLRTIRHEGETELSGPYVVEDVQVESDVFRRLIFLNKPEVIQSEVKLVREMKSKGGGKKDRKSLAESSLCQRHHVTMLAGLSLLEDLDAILEERLDILVVGLSCGVLSSYIHRHLDKAFVDVVEQDTSLVSIATDWFGFRQDDRLVVHTENEAQYVLDLASDQTGYKKHVVILEAASTGGLSGVRSPPAVTLDSFLIEAISRVLHPAGVLITILSTQDAAKRNEVLTSLNAIFSSVYTKQLSPKGKEVVFAISSGRNEQKEKILCGQNFSDKLKSSISKFEGKFTKVKQNLNLSEAMQGLRLQP